MNPDFLYKLYDKINNDNLLNNIQLIKSNYGLIKSPIEIEFLGGIKPTGVFQPDLEQEERNLLVIKEKDFLRILVHLDSVMPIKLITDQKEVEKYRTIGLLPAKVTEYNSREMKDEKIIGS